jgi:hypothetical protein
MLICCVDKTPKGKPTADASISASILLGVLSLGNIPSTRRVKFNIGNEMTSLGKNKESWTPKM